MDDGDGVVVVESGNGERRDDDVDDNRPPAPPKNRFVVAAVNVVSGDAKVNKWLLLQLLYALLVAP